MSKMTPDQIKQDLETAAYVDRLLPAVKSPRYKCCMPDIVYTPLEIAMMDKRKIKIKPTNEQVSIWETVHLKWLPVLEIDERRLIWKRANRIPWKILSREFGLCKSNLCERHTKALLKIEFFIKGQKNV